MLHYECSNEVLHGDSKDAPVRQEHSTLELVCAKKQFLVWGEACTLVSGLNKKFVHFVVRSAPICSINSLFC